MFDDLPAEVATLILTFVDQLLDLFNLLLVNRCQPSIVCLSCTSHHTLITPLYQQGACACKCQCRLGETLPGVCHR